MAESKRFRKSLVWQSRYSRLKYHCFNMLLIRQRKVIKRFHVFYLRLKALMERM